MNEPRRCQNCGARTAKATARFCEYCGTELPSPPEPEPAERGGEPVGPLGALEERFAALESHPAIRDLMDYTPRTVRPAVGLYGGAVFAGCFTFISLAILLVAVIVFPPLAVLPLLLVILGVVGLAKNLQKATDFSASPLERHPAVVVDKRTKISGSGGDGSAFTSYFVTLQFPGGERTEYTANGPLAGALAQGDLGVAYLKSKVLLDFQRVVV